MTSHAHVVRAVWDGRPEQWSDVVDTSEAFLALRRKMLELAAPKPTDRRVDLGAGTGFLTLPLARQ